MTVTAGVKVSARDQALSDWITDRLYYKRMVQVRGSSASRKGRRLSCSKTVPFFSKTQVTGRSLREAPSRSPSPVPYRLQTGSVITPMQRQRQKITWIWSTRLAPSKTDPQIPMRAVSITDVHLRGVVVGRAIGEKR